MQIMTLSVWQQRTPRYASKVPHLWHRVGISQIGMLVDRKEVSAVVRPGNLFWNPSLIRLAPHVGHLDTACRIPCVSERNQTGRAIFNKDVPGEDAV